MSLEYYDDRVQVTHSLNNEECLQVGNFLKDHSNMALRLIWFKDSNELEFLKKILNIKKLKINYSSVTDINFIEYLPELEELDISDMEKNLNVAAISNLRHLKVLNLNLHKASRQTDLSIISQCTLLEEFYFSGKFKKKSLDINTLQNIRILAPQLNTLNLQDISSLKYLKVLKIFEQKTDSLVGIENLTSIEKIHIYNLRMDDQNKLSPLFKLPRLKTLGLSYVHFIKDFSFITNRHNLEELILWSLNGLESYKGIEQLKKLKKLSHCGKHTSPNSINFQAIRNLQDVAELEIKVGKLNPENQTLVDKLTTSLF